MTRVVVVDDEVLVRVGVSACIDWKAHGFLIVGQASDGREALEIVEREGARIVLTDVLMPGMDGLELIAALRRGHPDVRVVVLSCHDDLEYVKAAMKLGAVDYVLKLSLRPEDLLRVLEEARAALPPAETVQVALAAEASLAAEALRIRVPGALDTDSYARRLSAALSAGPWGGVGAAAFRLSASGDAARAVRSCLHLAESLSGAARRIVGIQAGPETVAFSVLTGGAGAAAEEGIHGFCSDLRERIAAVLNAESGWAAAGPVEGAERIVATLTEALDSLAHGAFGACDGAPGTRVRPEIERVRAHVRAHLAERLSVRQAADLACMSPNHFSTVFRRETSESFVQFVNRLRMEKARQLIEREGYLAYQAAAAVGIEDFPYFSKLFKRITGTKASEARSGSPES